MQVRRFKCMNCRTVIVLEFVLEGMFDSFDKMQRCPVCAWPGRPEELDPNSFAGDLEFTRADGDARCRCGKTFAEHDYDKTVIGFNYRPYLRVLCDGSRVKL